MTRLFLCMVILLAGGSVSSSQHPLERRWASQVSESRLRSTVRTLVAIGNRWGGTPSGDAAADHVAKTMMQYGLDVTVTRESERMVFVHSGWTLRVRQPRRLRRLIRNEWLAGFSPPVPLSTAPLLDAGQEDLPEDLKGAVLLTSQVVSADRYQDFVDRGAGAILSYAPGLPGGYSDWSMITNLPPGDSHAIPLFNISYQNGAALQQELSTGGEIEIQYGARTRIGKGSPRTVIGTIKGSKNSFIVICAHGDSDAGGPGADDNASGVAGVLEMARIFGRMSHAGELTRPKETLKFIVWGAEYYSSEHFARSLGDTIEQIKGVLNFDEIGTGAARNCVYFESNDVPHNERLMKVLNAVGEEYAGKRGFWEESTTNPSQGGTDSYVFLPEYLERLDLPQVEIPSITIFTAAWNHPRTLEQTTGWTSKAWKGHPDSVTIDYSPYYHSSMDIPAVTTEKEPFNMTWAVKAVGIALLRIAW